MKVAWRKGVAPYVQDLRLWALVMVMLSVFRVLLIVIFHQRLGPDSGLQEIFQVLLYGLRFDCQVAGYVVALPVLFNLLATVLSLGNFVARIRVLWGAVFAFAALWVFIISLNFFHEFGSQFNHFLFIGMEDDTHAIVQTIWKEYHPIPTTLGFLVVFVLLLRFVRTLGFMPASSPVNETASGGPVPVILQLPFLQRGGVALLVLVLLVLSMRGSLGKRPAQRVDAAVSKDEFLNKTVLNPFVALNYAIKDHRRLNSTAGLGVFLADMDLDSALQRLFPESPASDNLDDYFLAKANGPKGIAPRHIFVLLMESYDSWPMLPQYQSLQLTEGLNGLVAEGLQVQPFLSSSPGTMASVAGILTGLPDSGLQTDLQSQTRFTYPTAPAAVFQKLGYRTRFFYGGKLGWRNIDEFARAQGFEEVYGGSHMGSWQHANEWGVDDEFLFDFVEQSLTDEQPTFNFILTTSYHPPYDIDVFDKGYPQHKFPRELEHLYDGSIGLSVWGHLWYADHEMTKFIRATNQVLPLSVFAITGDHFARKFLNAKPTAFERTAVPFVLFGPQVLSGVSVPVGAAGSHIDIGPTLIELAAPKGFAYHAFGRDLLDGGQLRAGFGRGYMVGPDYIAQLKPVFRFEPLPGQKLPEELPSKQELRQLYNDAHGVAWWRIRNGAKKNGSSPKDPTPNSSAQN